MARFGIETNSPPDQTGQSIGVFKLLSSVGHNFLLGSAGTILPNPFMAITGVSGNSGILSSLVFCPEI